MNKMLINTYTAMTMVLLLTACFVHAGEVSIPYEFVAGEKAMAGEVNSNFSELEAAVNDNHAAINANTDWINVNADEIDANSDAIATNSDAIDANTDKLENISVASEGLEVNGDIISIVNSTEYYMVPKGGIIMWSGSIDDIPSGWALCDGTDNTPDLSDRFILGVSYSEEPGAVGGSSSHNHTVPRNRVTFGHGNTFQGKDREVGFEIKAGRYRFVMNRYYYNPKWWSWAPDESGSGYLSGSPYYALHTTETKTSSANVLPPYYKLAFIMRM